MLTVLLALPAWADSFCGAYPGQSLLIPAGSHTLTCDVTVPNGDFTLASGASLLIDGEVVQISAKQIDLHGTIDGNHRVTPGPRPGSDAIDVFGTPGNGGGGGHAVVGGAGQSGGGGTIGAPASMAIDSGSSGGQGGNYNDGFVFQAGGLGGAGGAALTLTASQGFTLGPTARIELAGEVGADGNLAGDGGGGSGGGLLIVAGTVLLATNSYVSVLGGGDDGSPGRIKVFYGLSNGLDWTTDLASGPGTGTLWTQPLPSLCVDADGDGSTVCDGDCDDQNSAVRPREMEICDGGIDNDCDAATDENVIAGTPWYADADHDGFGDPLMEVQRCEPPANHVADPGDCEDGDPAVNPGATEVCNQVDDNCNLQVDEGLTLNIYYSDDDGDGYGGASQLITSCSSTAPPHTSALAGDCDDTAADVHPGAPELCDGIDNDCDVTTSDPSQGPWYVDQDQDGFGTGSGTPQCGQPAGTSDVDGDCNDHDDAIHPGAQERCNLADDDCDQDIDEEGPVYSYIDADQDGFGSGVGIPGCAVPAGNADRDGDCDDQDPTVNPGRPETCDGRDENCDHQVDEGLPTFLYYLDGDGDSYGSSDTVASCSSSPVAGQSLDHDDCNDEDPAIRPLAPEICNGEDDDCDLETDENLVFIDYWIDLDADGFGDRNTDPVTLCDPQPGLVPNGADCDDLMPAVNPAATEILTDGIDNDCDGLIDQAACYRDLDGDGYGGSFLVASSCTGLGEVTRTGDCDDDDPLVNPDVLPEDDLCGDGIDQDCDGRGGPDDDEDGDDLTHLQEVAYSTSDCAIDFDGDQIPDNLEIFTYGSDPTSNDSDGDGVPDGTEVAGILDHDNDGILDILDDDDDGDGVPTAVEGQIDTDQDGLDDYIDRDDDGDTVLTIDEPGDSDGDAIPDRLDTDDDDDGVLTIDERTWNTSWTDPDTDGDGIPDGVEWGPFSQNPRNTNGDGDFTCVFGDPASDRSLWSVLDAPGDDLIDALDVDDDGDGLETAYEGSGDQDGDGVPDYRDRDTDGDSFLDACEETDGIVDLDQDGIVDFRDADDGDGATGDADHDNLSNGVERALLSNPLSADSDHDGLLDCEEAGVPCPPTASVVNTTLAIAPDLSGDGRPDLVDFDDDGDGAPTFWELVVVLDTDGRVLALPACPAPNALATPTPVWDGATFVWTCADGSPFTGIGAGNDTDGDGLANHRDDDDDGDGVLSLEEDLDNDGDPRNDDADGDGILDFLDGPIEPNEDGDGIPASDELRLCDDPRLDEADCNALLTLADADGDGVLDGDEVDWNDVAGERMPALRDTDADGIFDLFDADDDDDGIPTRTEGDVDVDGDGLGNHRDLDSDGDGLTDEAEGTDDEDGDGIPNYLDALGAPAQGDVPPKRCGCSTDAVPTWPLLGWMLLLARRRRAA